MTFTPLDRIISLGNDGVYTSTVDAATARDQFGTKRSTTK